MTSWFLRALTVVAMAFAGAVVLGPGPAAAHTGLATSMPTDGEVLAAAPEEVALTFTEELQPNFVQVAVTTADGGSVSAGATVVEGAVVRQQVRIDDADFYVVAYRVVSADGHPVSGQLSFSLTGEDAAQGVATTAPSAPGTPTAGPAPADTSADEADGGGSWIWPFLGLTVVLIALGTLPFLWLLRKTDG